MEPERFKVDLRGVVDLLSTAIYSSPRVYLRELIQNAADAITARSLLDPSWHTAGMVITPAGVAGPQLRIRDDGIGLTAHEVADALATVGGSLKRDALGLPATGMLGRFGIGLLSALMVSDEIVLQTRSARGGPAVEWIGRSDGTYVLRELTDDLPIGTQITLITRADDANLVGPRAVHELATQYAAYLPVPIHIADVQGLTTITQDPAFLSADPATLIDIGTEILGVRPFDAIPIDIPLTGTRGVAFVLPHPVPPQSVGSHTVYCRRMLVTDRSRQIAPEWAFFARIIVDSTGVNPTASREALIEDEALTSTREAIGMALRRWIAQLATQDPLRLEAFVATHYLGLKALAVHDDEIAPLIVRLLPMETSRGITSVAELVAASSEILYVPTTDQFRQVNALSSGRQVVVNATYTWDAEVLRRLPSLIAGVTVREVSVTDVLDRLEPVWSGDRAAAMAFEARADGVLAQWDCRATVRVAQSGDVPAYLLTDPHLIRRTERERAQEAGTSRWSRVLQTLESVAHDREAATGRTLLLNWGNPLVRRLADIEDPLLLGRNLRLLHLQSTLATGRPLSALESDALTATLTDLMILAMTEGTHS
ncbi:MAG: HSP90 family protein [Phycicoccus sp.]|nr:HSP90 family protein [Phycicoccus sp.]